MFGGVIWSVLTVPGATAGTVMLCVGAVILVSMAFQPPQEDVAEVLTAVRATHPEASTMRVLTFVRTRRPDLDITQVQGILNGLRAIGVVESYEKDGVTHDHAGPRTRGVPMTFWRPKGPLPPHRVGSSVRMLLARASAR